MLYEFHCPKCGADATRTMSLNEYDKATEDGLDIECDQCGGSMDRRWSRFGIEIK